VAIGLVGHGMCWLLAVLSCKPRARLGGSLPVRERIGGSEARRAGPWREPNHGERHLLAGVSQCQSTYREATPMSTLLLIILVLALLGALPSWPYSRSWGYGPSGAVGVVLVLLLIVVLLDRSPI